VTRWLLLVAVMLTGCPGDLDFQGGGPPDGAAALTGECADAGPCTTR
jgi:hypothetical protein